MCNDPCAARLLQLLKVMLTVIGASLLWLLAGIGSGPANARSLQPQIAVVQMAHDRVTTVHASADVYTTYLPLLSRPAKIYLPVLSYWNSQYVRPGTYPFGYCHDWNFYSIHDGTTLAGTFRFCVDSVNVRSDFYMQFNVSWILIKLVPPFNYAVKYSDYANRNMNVTDNIGCRYDHVATGEAAAVDTYFNSVGESHTGWFLFPPACLASTVFTFHDDDQHFVINNLVLGHPPY